MSIKGFEFGLFIILTALLLSTTSCTLLDEKLVLQESSFTKIDGWKADDHEKALSSFLNSCKKLESFPAGRAFHKSGLGGENKRWKKLCYEAGRVNSSLARGFFESNFTPYLATNWGKPEGVFTGYFEIGLEGSKRKHGPYQYPIYKRPNGMKNGSKYYSREQINRGALEGRGLEVVWVNDPVRLFFLHVQGSGRVKMDDGSVIRVGYDGKNGHGYVSIGRYMIDKGYISEDKISAQSIKKWLYSNPNKMAGVFNINPSYIFFKEIGKRGPIGGQGVPLTPMRSLAVDKRFVPYGAPVWVDVKLNARSQKNKGFKQLLIAQDTGSAIRGPVRGDIFFGYGDMAEELAGYQNNIGRYFILLPTQTAVN